MSAQKEGRNRFVFRTLRLPGGMLLRFWGYLFPSFLTTMLPWVMGSPSPVGAWHSLKRLLNLAEASRREDASDSDLCKHTNVGVLPAWGS
jgi:hypothetical protein